MLFLQNVDKLFPLKEKHQGQLLQVFWRPSPPSPSKTQLDNPQVQLHTSPNSSEKAEPSVTLLPPGALISITGEGLTKGCS